MPFRLRTLVLVLGIVVLAGCPNPVDPGSDTPVPSDPASSNTNLASLSIDETAISPAFSAATTAYSATVGNTVNQVTVNAAPSDPDAEITSGTGVQAVSVGTNDIAVVVAAEDGSTKTYVITVTREDAISRSFRARTATDDTWYDVPASRLASGTHVDVFVEEGHGISISTADAIANEFDANIYGMIRANFANEYDVDGNGKVILLLLDIVDGYSGTGGYVAGYFDPTHMFSADTQPNSNEADMLFMDVDPATPATEGFYSTAAHEMQHLVNFSATYLVDGTRQDTWINEGLSSGAEYLYAGDHVEPRIYYYNNDPLGTIARGNNFYIWYGYWESVVGDTLANYSTVYLFFQWLRIHASNDTAIYADILDSSSRDYKAVVDAAAERIDPSLDTWDEVLGSWMQANSLTDFGGTGLQGYGGEITPTAWGFSTSAGQIELSSGEGIVVPTPAGSYDYPGGSDPSIRYQGVDVDTYTVDESGPNYSGDGVIVFNSNTLIDPADPTETALLPPQPDTQTSSLYSIAGSENGMPESYPIGVSFEAGHGFERDGDGQDSSSHERRGTRR